MLKNLLIVSVFFCLFVLTVPAHSAGPNMQPGEWEIAMTMDMPGLPAMANVPIKAKVCLTEKDLVPQKQEKGCNVTKQKQDGNTVTWEVKCDDGTTGDGRVTYAGTNFDGLVNMNMNNKGKQMKTKMKMNGKRLGACK
jgi:hypothetical protein